MNSSCQVELIDFDIDRPATGDTQVKATFISPKGTGKENI